MSKIFTIQEIQSHIKTLPNHPPFMLDQDLAELYETKVKHLNQAVKRNFKRFPRDFYFQLDKNEVKILRSQSVTTISPMTRTAPYAFTREGANMLSAVLQTDVAIDRSVQIMRAFSSLESKPSMSSDGLFEIMKEILRNQEMVLKESQWMASQILNQAQDLTKLNERMNILENQIESMMKVKGSFNEKHWLFGKFVEVIAEGIDQNREEISKLKKQFENTLQQQIKTPAKKVRKLNSKSKSK